MKFVNSKIFFTFLSIENIFKQHNITFSDLKALQFNYESQIIWLNILKLLKLKGMQSPNYRKKNLRDFLKV